MGHVPSRAAYAKGLESLVLEGEREGFAMRRWCTRALRPWSRERLRQAQNAYPAMV